MRDRRRPILLSALVHTALYALLLGSAPLRPGAGLAALMAGLGFTMVAGARVYPLTAYLTAFSLCLIIMLGTCLAALNIREAVTLRTAPAEAAGTPGYKK